MNERPASARPSLADSPGAGHAAPTRSADADHAAKPRVSVVICTHTLDRWPDIEAAVASVLDQTHPAHEVLLAVDHNDVLYARARRAFPAVRVFRNDGAPGASGARNAAVRHATGDVIAFMDDDARADRRWLEAIVRAHADPRVLGTCGRIEPLWEGPPPEWMPPELYWIFGCSYRGLPTTAGALRRAIGANMSLVREVVDEVGGFDESIGRRRGVPASCEDTELGIRALRARPGTVLAHAPDARVDHVVRASRTNWRYLAWRCWTEGRAKADLTRAVGPGAGLSDDRSYATRVLPVAFAAGLRDALRGDPNGLPRAAAIVAALGLTAAGYLYGLAVRPPRREGWR